MNYTAIHIQGNILSSEILEKIRTEDIRYQKATDFGLHPNAPVRDEINLAWSIAVTSWNAFGMKREQLSDTDSGTSETRRYWMLPLLQQILGYEIAISTAEIINGKSYAISHRASNRDGFPVHIVGVNQSLDKRPETGGTRLSPHALVQEYVNSTEHLYALVSNGRHLRLLRDATRLSRLSYLEFDLEQIMEQGLYTEFALLYRALHASRMPVQKESGAESVMEYYHQEALSSGSRIRERLSGAVENSIRELANGLLHYPANEELRRLVLDGRILPTDYYLYTLRLVYRILFLLVIEERKLIYGEKLDEGLLKKRNIYYDFYSVRRLTLLAEKLVYVDSRKCDLWQSLITTFSLFENQELGSKLGISPLGSGLFAPDALGELKYQQLSNESLLKVLRYLVTFENENLQRVRVNYADLDVEEFGSVYEGLLEYDPEITDNAGQPVFGFVAGTGRSSSGSHYTPEELVKPLITHSLDYLIEERLQKPEQFLDVAKRSTLSRPQQTEAALLSLTICDVACGSGHILLSAARRVGFELAKVRSGEDQPTPTAMRMAVRDVISHCIYGVDLNPLAVELCKVALWLEAHEPGQPLNFLDHRIKCGNAIVGLAHREELEKGIATEAFKTLPGDEKELAKLFRDQNIKDRKLYEANTLDYKLDFEATTNHSVHEALAEYRSFVSQPETTPDEIARKASAYNRFINGRGYGFLKAMADTQVAQFFIAKTTANKDYLITDAEYRQILTGHQGWQDRRMAMANAVAQEKRVFHWFLEFPEVFAGGKATGNENLKLSQSAEEPGAERSQSGGFDCILGNPPFLGGQKLSGSYGDNFLECIKYEFAPIGAVDLVTYFFRRIFTLIKPGGFQSLISTNTIAQGKAREDGLDVIMQHGGSINHAVRSMRWPGIAAVEVALVTITKQNWQLKRVLDGKEVKTITPYLDDAVTIGNPHPLKQNEGKSFQGSIVLGKGFILTPEEAQALIEKDPRNKEVLFPYLNGDDLNNNPDQRPSRWVINFFDWTEEKAREYPDCYKIIEEKVKPERQRWALDKNGNEIVGEYALRKPLPEKWWIYGEKRPGLYRAISKMDNVLVVAKTAKYIGTFLYNSKIVLDQSLTIGVYKDFKSIAIIQCSLCDVYSKTFGTTMETRFRFNIENLETFPFPQNLTTSQVQKLEEIGETYHEHRRQLMLRMQLGLTKTYNAFHAKEIQESRIKSQDLKELDKKTIEKQYGKEVWNLWNHLQKHSHSDQVETSEEASVCTLEEAISGIVELRRLHVLMDEAVLEAYSWNVDRPQQPAIRLRHDFYEVDYLPENDRIRFTIHPDARKAVLKRLLELNRKIHDEEVAAGLWDKKTTSKKAAKAYPKVGKTTLKASEPEAGYGGLFDGVEE
ncbi:MAG: restriction endonuclease [Paludibacter sp.]|nr:restriction endonuclease [Paludibacter sp.]